MRWRTQILHTHTHTHDVGFPSLISWAAVGDHLHRNDHKWKSAEFSRFCFRNGKVNQFLLFLRICFRNEHVGCWARQNPQHQVTVLNICNIPEMCCRCHFRNPTEKNVLILRFSINFAWILQCTEKLPPPEVSYMCHLLRHFCIIKCQQFCYVIYYIWFCKMRYPQFVVRNGSKSLYVMSLVANSQHGRETHWNGHYDNRNAAGNRLHKWNSCQFICVMSASELKRSVGNRQRARPLRTRPHKRVTLIMVGLFTTEATIKVKHIRRGELYLMQQHMFLATVADGQTVASCGERKTHCKHSPWLHFWVGPHWVGPWAVIESVAKLFRRMVIFWGG